MMDKTLYILPNVDVPGKKKKKKRCQVVFLLLSLSIKWKFIHTNLHLYFRYGVSHKGIIIFGGPCHQMFEPLFWSR